MAYRTLNPFTEQTIQEFANHTDGEVEAALAKADALYHSNWSKGDIAPRLAVLDKLSALLTENREKLARTMALEMGKPVAQGQKEVDLCASIARFYATNSAVLLKPQPVANDVGEGWIEFHADRRPARSGAMELPDLSAHSRDCTGDRGWQPDDVQAHQHRSAMRSPI